MITASETQKITKRPGTSPGMLVFTGEKKMDHVGIRLIRYDAASVEEKEFESVEECLEHRKGHGVKWINIDGLHDVEVVRKIGHAFEIHSLVLEDIVGTGQRPKIDAYEHHLFLVLKMFYPDEAGSGVSSEQVSFVLGKDYLLSFQERTRNIFDEVRRRIQTGGNGHIRKSGADYLFYALIDAVVDHYFIVLETLSDRLEEVDEELGSRPGPQTLRKIHDLKKEIVSIRKSLWPLRELFNSILRMETGLLKDTTRVFLRDVCDHIIRALDNLESYREMISSLMDLYQSGIGNKMNEIMKVLTIIATLFIPPTFVAGIYGMNFENMPELHSRYGYFFVISLMLAAILAMLIYFRRKKWI